MVDFLRGLLAFVVPFFAVVSMAGAGLGETVRDVARPFRRPAFLLMAWLANFVLVPLLGYGIARLLDLDAPNAIGLFLLSTGAGAAFLVALVRLAQSDLTLATGLLASLLVATIVYMPLLIPAVLPWAGVEAMQIARPLMLTMLLPLIVGLAVRALAPRLADTLQPLFTRVAPVALIVLIGATLVLHLPSIVALVGSGALGAAFLLTLGAFVIGYTLGGSNPERRAVLGLGTGQRNVAAAMVVASGAFEDPGPLVMVVVSSLVAFLVLFPAAYLLKRSRARGTVDTFGSSPGEPAKVAGE